MATKRKDAPAPSPMNEEVGLLVEDSGLGSSDGSMIGYGSVGAGLHASPSG